MGQIDLSEINLLIVNMSQQDDMKLAKSIIEDNRLEAYAYFDVGGDLAKYYGIIGVPAILVLDSQGLIEDFRYGGDLVEVIENLN